MESIIGIHKRQTARGFRRTSTSAMVFTMTHVGAIVSNVDLWNSPVPRRAYTPNSMTGGKNGASSSPPFSCNVCPQSWANCTVDKRRKSVVCICQTPQATFIICIMFERNYTESRAAVRAVRTCKFCPCCLSVRTERRDHRVFW